MEVSQAAGSERRTRAPRESKYDRQNGAAASINKE